MYPFSCVLWAIFWFRQIARYLPHHRSENASKTHPKSSHDKFKTASKTKLVCEKRGCIKFRHTLFLLKYPYEKQLFLKTNTTSI